MRSDFKMEQHIGKLNHPHGEAVIVLRFD